MINWSRYSLFDPVALGPSAELSRSEARGRYLSYMEHKSERIAMMLELVAGSNVQVDDTDEGIQRLNNWFRCHIEADAELAGRPSVQWLSVTHDITMFLGDTMIKRCPQLHWAFSTWKIGGAYQEPVIMGFTRPPVRPGERYVYALNRLVTSYAVRIVMKERKSVPQEGRVRLTSGGVIDLDLVAARDVERIDFVEDGYFVELLQRAESFA